MSTAANTLAFAFHAEHELLSQRAIVDVANVAEEAVMRVAERRLFIRSC